MNFELAVYARSVVQKFCYSLQIEGLDTSDGSESILKTLIGSYANRVCIIQRCLRSGLKCFNLAHYKSLKIYQLRRVTALFYIILCALLLQKVIRMIDIKSTFFTRAYFLK